MSGLTLFTHFLPEPQEASVVQGPEYGAGHAPQSLAQVEQFSVPLQLPSPHDGGHTLQSLAQFEQVSVPSQTASPHTTGHAPQSSAQLRHVSPSSQVSSPHAGAGASKRQREGAVHFLF